jgi:hypothetical protein
MTNTLTYRAQLQVTNEMNCCDYSARIVNYPHTLADNYKNIFVIHILCYKAFTA